MLRCAIPVLPTLLLGLFVGVTPALATNILGHTAGYDSIVTFKKSYLTGQTSTAFNSSDVNNVEPTDVTTWIWTTDGSQNNCCKEINVYDATYAGTWYGQWLCDEYDGNVCVDARVRINLTYTYTNLEMRSLVCEEVGHGVSLAHRETTTTTCMARPVCWDCEFLNSHDKDPHQ